MAKATQLGNVIHGWVFQSGAPSGILPGGNQGGLAWCLGPRARMGEAPSHPVGRGHMVQPPVLLSLAMGEPRGATNRESENIYRLSKICQICLQKVPDTPVPTSHLGQSLGQATTLFLLEECNHVLTVFLLLSRTIKTHSIFHIPPEGPC